MRKKYETNFKRKRKTKKIKYNEKTITSAQKEIKINFNNNKEEIINFKQNVTINNNNQKNNFDNKNCVLTGTINIYKDTYLEKKNKNNSKNEKIEKNENDEFVVDLRDDLEAQLLSEITNKNKLKYKENNVVLEDLDNKLNEIKKFRTYGFYSVIKNKKEIYIKINLKKLLKIIIKININFRLNLKKEDLLRQ